MATKKTKNQAVRKNQALPVHVIPRARKNEIVGLQEDGRLRIRLNAAPEGGKANQVLLEFLALHLQVPVSHIHIVSGATSQDKLVRFDGLGLGEVIIRLLEVEG